jgi:hypothetical protein
LGGELLRLGAWVRVEDGRLIHFTPDEADAGTILEIDRGIQNHG